MTLISRITGLVRDVVFAGLIGAGAGVAADAFYVAFRIPNFLRRIFGEGAFSQAFVPVLSEYKTRATVEETRAFVDHLTGVLGVILFGVTLIGVLAAPILVMVLAPGFLDEPYKYDLTVQMLRIMFPYLLFVSLVAMAAGIPQYLRQIRRRRVYTGIAQPLSYRRGTVARATNGGNRCWRWPGACSWRASCNCFFKFRFCARCTLPRPRLKPAHPGVGRVFKLMLPAIFGVSVSQVNLLVNTLLASFLVTGSVSWLYYSDRIMEFPLGVFGIALATVILPSLSRKHANNSHEEFSHLLDWALRWVMLVGLPASVALVVLSGPMLATLFHHGAFNAHDVRMSADALMAFSTGLLAFIFIKVLAPGFYARQDTKTPVRIGIIAMLVNIVLSLALVFPLQHIGLALAISLAAFVNAALLYHRLRTHNVYQPLPGWSRFLLRVTLATAGMGALLAWGAGDLEHWLTASTQDRVIQLTLWVIAGLITYGGLILALGVRPAQMLLRKPDGARSDD